MDCQDNRSDMQKRLQRIAVDGVVRLRQASDDREVCTPKLVGEVQDRFVELLTQVYYGFHPQLQFDKEKP